VRFRASWLHTHQPHDDVFCSQLTLKPRLIITLWRRSDDTSNWVVLDWTRLDWTSAIHSAQTTGKSLGTGCCGWWYPIETWSVGILPVKLLIVRSFFSDCPRLTHNWRFPRNKIYRNRFLLISPIQQKRIRTSICNVAESYDSYLLPEYDVWLTICCARFYNII